MVKQLSFFDELTENSPSAVLDLPDLHFEIQRLLPATRIYSFYKRFGRKHDYSLASYVSALHTMVDLTEPICQKLDKHNAKTLISHGYQYGYAVLKPCSFFFFSATPHHLLIDIYPFLSANRISMRIW